MSDPRPTASVCPSCGRLVNAQARRCPHCGRTAPDLFGANRWLDRLFQGRRPMGQWITIFTLLVTGLVFLDTSIEVGASSLFQWDTSHSWNQFGSLNPQLVLDHHQYWRLFTWLFLHANLLHVGLNMLFLVWFGLPVEQVYGRGRFVLIYFGSGMAAAVASMAHHMATGGSTIGASGAVFGLVGALLSYGLRRKDAVGRSIVGRILFFVILSFLWVVPGDQSVDHLAHGGGLVGGFLLGRVMRTRDQTRRGEGPGVRLAALVTLVLALASVGVGAVAGTPALSRGGPNPMLAENWGKFMFNLDLIERGASHLDRTRKAEFSRTMASFRSLFEREAERLGDDGAWLEDLIGEWKELNELLAIGAEPAVLSDKAGAILEKMEAAPATWAGR